MSLKRAVYYERKSIDIYFSTVHSGKAVLDRLNFKLYSLQISAYRTLISGGIGPSPHSLAFGGKSQCRY